MNWFHKLRLRFRALFHKEKLDARMDDEMRSHIEMQTQENIEAGMKPGEARYSALRQFGWVESIKETCRDQRGLPWLETLWQDIRYGCRLLAASPGFTIISVVSLAIGIGANCAIFSFADALLLRPLPVARPGEALTVGSTTSIESFGASALVSSYRDFVDIRDRSKSFEGLAAFTFLTAGFATDPAAVPKLKMGCW